jgi:hypothetical protein
LWLEPLYLAARVFLSLKINMIDKKNISKYSLFNDAVN